MEPAGQGAWEEPAEQGAEEQTKDSTFESFALEPHPFDLNSKSIH